MGGCGTWDLLSRYPNLFAAAFPIAGPPGDRKGLAPLIKEVPIWVFHGDNDRVAPVESSRNIVAALKAVAAPVKYLTAAEGGVSHFRYGRDNTLLTWMHLRLMAGFLLRLPALLARRLGGRPPFDGRAR